MSLTPGDRLGPYEILAPIGAGGMGEVYRAKDSRLHREVAVKVSKEQFSERFEREAQAVAALNHPHICQIYDVGPNYLVMELIEGSALKGPLPVEKAIEYAGQILDALDSAHHKGITHRDLKPANILVTRQGIKLLDFGLAKFSGTFKETDSTVTQALTQEGTIAGTLQYMSPEQLQAGQTDSRSDLFAFGCVLYEMLTGKRAFDGKNTASVIAAILEREPPKLDVVPALDRVVRRSLAKDPEQRFQTARDLKAALNWALEQPPVVSNPKPSRRWAYWTAITAFAAAALFLGFFRFRETPVPLSVIRTTILPPAKTSFSYFAGTSATPVLSPDGHLLVFGARSEDGHSQLYVRSLDSTVAQPLPGTDNAVFPFWSPDSRSIGFFADGKVKKIDATGGPVVPLANATQPRGGSWAPGTQGESQDGVIVFGGGTVAVAKVPASGGSATPATDPKTSPGTHRWPWFLPDGRHFLYIAALAGSDEGEIRVGSLDPEEHATPDRVLGTASSQAVYSQGQILFLHDQTLMAQPFDAQSLVVTGQTVPITEHVAGIPTSVHAIFTVSSGGALAYQTGPGASLSLTWFDRSGTPTGTVGELANLFRINLSPDRKLVAASAAASGNMDLWIYDLPRGLRSRFTFDPAREFEAVWSPDGKTLLFNSFRKGHFDLYRKPLNTTATEELLYADDTDKYPTSWSGDGKHLLYHGNAVGSSSDIFALPLASGGKPVPFLQTKFTEYNAQFSPDDRWVAYVSTESGRNEVYVAPFPGPGGKRQISVAGGRLPRWRADGRELFYIGGDQKLMSAEMSLKADSVEVGAVRSLFAGLPVTAGYQHDISADGQRFLAIIPPQQTGPSEPLTLVQNWIAGLKK